MSDASRILIIGVGDLGTRIAHALATDAATDEIVLGGRNASRGGATAALLNECGLANVTFEQVDALRCQDIERLLRRVRPDLVVQAASLLSPWDLLGRDDPAVHALLAAGFAAQLPAQLPIVSAVMTAAKGMGFNHPIVNCSFPDVTHAILRCHGIEPTIGTGNVAMIARRVSARLRRGGEPKPLVRVLAHHCHVTGAIRSAAPEAGATRPRVFIGEEGARGDQLVYEGKPLVSERSLNALSAASAIPVIRALLPKAHPTRLSTPAPHGLPGGYPVFIKDGRIELDLPPDVTVADAVDFHFTEPLRAALSRIEPSLAEPLSYSSAYARFLLLRERLEAPGSGV
jgi:hypothetical protein